LEILFGQDLFGAISLIKLDLVLEASKPYKWYTENKPYKKGIYPMLEINCNNPECNNPLCQCDPCECTEDKPCTCCDSVPE
jgi:hypothetical protein